nr:ankyrin repeat family protein [Oriental turtle dovepox virus]
MLLAWWCNGVLPNTSTAFTLALKSSKAFIEL